MRRTVVHEVPIHIILNNWAGQYEMTDKEEKIVKRNSYIDTVKNVAVFVLDIDRITPGGGE